MADDEAPDLTAGVSLADVPEGGLLAGRVGDADVMLARWTDDAGRERVSALDAKCTHRGAPLAAGGLRVGDRVHCQFHHACFDLRSGEALVAPAIAPLGRWHVDVEDGTVRVTDAAPADLPQADGPAAGTPATVDDVREVRRVVVIGGGAAGFAAVERLRREGWDGSLVLLAPEGEPVDRTFFSKAYLEGGADASALPMEPSDWYAEHDVDLRTVRATAIDLAARTVSLEQGDDLGYDALVIATGAEPTRPDLPGFDRDDVLVLRTRADADAIAARLDAAGDGARVVVVGAGFIGLEAAAALRARGAAVTVLGSSDVPLARQLGADLGRMVKALHEEQGVEFVTGRAAAWSGSSVRLEDGREVEGDLVVLGLGVTPRTALAEAAGLEVDDGIVVDARGETQTFGVFAAGDVARYPEPGTGRLIRVEHWAVAQRQGALAAVNLLGGDETALEPPFFWTKQFAAQIRFAGHAEDTSDASIDGDPADRDAVVTFREGGRVTAVAGVGRDHEVLELEERLLRAPAATA